MKVILWSAIRGYLHSMTFEVATWVWLHGGTNLQFCEKGPPIASWIYCGEMYNRRFGDIVPDYYRTKAHFLGQYELDGTGGIGEEPKIAYNPYMSFMGSDPGVSHSDS